MRYFHVCVVLLISPFLALPEADAAPAVLSEFSSLIDHSSGLVLKAGSSGGDAEAAKATPEQEACESKGNRWDPQAGRCIKQIVKKKTAPPVTSGGDAEAAKATPEQEACESKGKRWDPQTGTCFKVIAKPKKSYCKDYVRYDPANSHDGTVAATLKGPTSFIDECRTRYKGKPECPPWGPIVRCCCILSAGP